MTDRWDIEEGPVDPVLFFRLLAEHFPQATTLYAEGTAIEPDVQSLYEANVEPGKHLPGPQTIWPTSKKFRCQFTPSLCLQLSELAKRHAEPELVDHFFLYSGSEPLLEWHDAFANAMLLSYSIPEAQVKAFAGALKLPYGKAKAG
jgi:hypothetical protein